MNANFPRVWSKKIFLPFGLLAAALLWVVAYQRLLPFWDWLIYDQLGFSATSRLGSSIHFFFYDTCKILLLLSGIIFVVTIVRSFFSVERTRALLGGRSEGVGNIIAALLGVVTPFCSCSAVPAFIGFVGAGVPLGVTFSFLIASPMVNEVAVVLLYGLFGAQIALFYVLSGLVVAVVAGLVIGRLQLERYVEAFVFETKIGQGALLGTSMHWEQRIASGWQEVKNIIGKVWLYLLVGIAIGALIHGWAPEDFFLRYAGANNPFAVLVAVLMGIPLYSNAAGVLPIVTALHAKGLAMGTLLAFMQSVVALSLPEVILLRRVLQPPLIAAFIGITGLGIILVGYVFNILL
ncbi:MAG: permease [Deinococcales bacterium]